MTIDEAITVLEMQEEILQFSHFTNEDAWELGCIIAAEAKRKHFPVAVSIRLNNGLRCSNTLSDGTNLNNENWMARKSQYSENTGAQQPPHLYDASEKAKRIWGLVPGFQKFAACGGGFPVRVEEVGVIGTIVVSGLDHVSDHELIVKCVSRYLHIDEVPRIPREL